MDEIKYQIGLFCSIDNNIAGFWSPENENCYKKTMTPERKNRSEKISKYLKKANTDYFFFSIHTGNKATKRFSGIKPRKTYFSKKQLMIPN